MSYRVYLDQNFNPVPPAQATLVKVVRAGRVSFYSKPAAQKAEYKPATRVQQLRHAIQKLIKVRDHDSNSARST